MNDYIKSDLMRYYGKYDIFTFLRGYLTNRVVRFQVAFRLCHEKGLTKIIGRILWFLNRNKYNIQMSKNLKVGYGLYIAHGGPVRINDSAIIGNNCTLSQFLTIGTNGGQAAIVGDNVYIGPNVCLVENVKIGNNVTIGAGSVVTKDIPDNATVAGNYAKVLNYNNPGRFIGNRWEVKKNPGL